MNFNSLFRRKTIADVLKNPEADPHNSGGQLVKNLKLRDLVSMGIAAVIGAGIFSTIGRAAYDGKAGGMQARPPSVRKPFLPYATAANDVMSHVDNLLSVMEREE